MAPPIRRFVVSLFLTLLLPASLLAQEVLSAGEVVAMESPAPELRLPYGQHPLQFGHLRLPEAAGPHPVFIFIHGGCWLSAYEIGHVGPLEEAVADAGYAVWSIEYRRVGDEGGGWPGTFLDVGRGVDAVAGLADEYALDLNRVIVSGHSAGGQLALWVAARSRISPSSDVYSADPIRVHGVLALAPASDLESLHASASCGGVVDRLMGGSPEEVSERYDAASPMRLMPIGVPQRIVIGAYDRAWAPGGRAYFERASARDGVGVTMTEAPESGHFEMVVPTTSTWPLILSELDALSSELARRGR